MRTVELLTWSKSIGGNHLPPLLQRGNQDVMYFEQIKALRAKVETKIDQLHTKVIGVTSSIAGEGKTLSSANLAANLSSAGMRKVLLMDVDLRKGDLSRGMAVNMIPGLSEFLVGSVEEKDIMRESIHPGLTIVPTGTLLSNPADLLAGERFRTFLLDARQHYDVVILDTPPILPVSDSLTLRDQVDGFLFIFRTGHTPHIMLKEALEELGEQRVFGVVLNGVEARSSKYYHRYYGKYYNKT